MNSMGGPWLYSIAEGPGRTFDIDGASIPVTIEAYRQLVKNGRIIEDRWWRISQHWEHVLTGDDVFIYTGEHDLGIIGYAKIKSVQQRGQDWCLEPEFDLSKCRLLLQSPISASVVRSWELNLRRNPVDLNAVATELYSQLPWHTATTLPEEVQEGSTYSEGSVQRILVNRYERDPRARAQCIDHYGCVCAVCGFDFVAKYGQVMAGYIHVHHLKPLSGLGVDYSVDPIQDLRPVCANCHAVAHRKDPPYSLDDIQHFLQSQL